MHLDTVLTMIDRDAFTIYPDLRDALVPYVIQPGPTRALDREARGSLRRGRPRAGPSLGSARRDRAATATSPSVSSGTTATTSLRSRRVWSSPTSGTSRRTPAFATRTSRSSPSPAPSSGAAAAVPAACPARSSVMRFQRRSDGEDRRRCRRLGRRRPRRSSGRSRRPACARPLFTSCTPGWFR